MAELFWRRSAARLVVLLLVTFLITTALLNRNVFEASGQSRSITATYTHGIVHLTIPYHMTTVGQGTLITEVLDPDDRVLGRSEQHLEIGHRRGSFGGSIRL
jgi:hypothetical protein